MAIVESGAGYASYLMDRLDEKYERFHLASPLKRKPSEYSLDQCFFGIIRDPKAISMHEHLPFDRLMFGSDFPHSVGSFPNTQRFLDECFEGLDDSLRRSMLLENPARYFGLDLDADITETPV